MAAQLLQSADQLEEKEAVLITLRAKLEDARACNLVVAEKLLLLTKEKEAQEEATEAAEAVLAALRSLSATTLAECV